MTSNDKNDATGKKTSTVRGEANSNLMEIEEDGFIEEEILVIGNFIHLDDQAIFKPIEKLDIQGHSILELSDISSSTPKALLQSYMEFTGAHEINLGSFLLFEEEPSEPPTSTIPNITDPKIKYYGTSINQIEFEMIEVKIPPGMQESELPLPTDPQTEPTPLSFSSSSAPPQPIPPPAAPSQTKQKASNTKAKPKAAKEKKTNT